MKQRAILRIKHHRRHILFILLHLHTLTIHIHIPLILLVQIPTSKVGEVFEKLIGKVGKLLDVRKVREKEEAECRVLEAMKARRSGENRGEESSGANNESSANYTPAKSEIPDSQGTPDVDGEPDDADEAEVDEEDAEDDAEDAEEGEERLWSL